MRVLWYFLAQYFIIHTLRVSVQTRCMITKHLQEYIEAISLRLREVSGLFLRYCSVKLNLKG